MNGSEDNLCFLCLKHHSRYDSTTSQHKNYTSNEVKDARAKLYGEVAGWSARKWYVVVDGTFSAFDKTRVETLAEHLRTILADAHLSVKRIEHGSVRLIVESSDDAFQKMKSLLKAGDGASLTGYQVQEVGTQVSEGLVEAIRSVAPTKRRGWTSLVIKLMRWSGLLVYGDSGLTPPVYHYLGTALILLTLLFATNLLAWTTVFNELLYSGAIGFRTIVAFGLALPISATISALEASFVTAHLAAGRQQLAAIGIRLLLITSAAFTVSQPVALYLFKPAITSRIHEEFTLAEAAQRADQWRLAVRADPDSAQRISLRFRNWIEQVDDSQPGVSVTETITHTPAGEQPFVYDGSRERSASSSLVNRMRALSDILSGRPASGLPSSDVLKLGLNSRSFGPKNGDTGHILRSLYWSIVAFSSSCRSH